MNKVIVISGGSQGLGKSIVVSLMENNFKIATCSRHENDFTKQMQINHPKKFFWQPLDISDRHGVKKFIQSVYKKFNRIDALINNAAVAYDGLLVLQPYDQIEKMLAVNLAGSIYLTRETLRYMMSKGTGVILNISSIIGQKGYSGLSVYSATKSALDGMTRSLARELGGADIRVNAIAPSYLDTKMSSTLNDEKRGQIIRRTPLNRLGKTKDIIGMVAFLLSDDARFITGQVITIDGGINC